MTLSRRSFLSELGKNTLDFIIPPASAGINTNHKIIYISLRGGMDGLNTIVPYGDSNYYHNRPTVAIKKPGQGDNSAIDLDGFFAMNPNMRTLKPLYDSGKMAVIHATGAPFVTRSHFEAQKSMEAAYGTNSGYTDGWLSRYLGATNTSNASPFRAISVQSAITQSLSGSRSATALSTINGFDLQTRNNLDFLSVLNSLYTGQSGQLGEQATDTIDALSLLDFYNPADFKTENGIEYPETPFGKKLSQTAKYIKSGLGTEIYSLEFGSWDHHDNLTKKLSPKLNELSAGIDALYTDLGEFMNDTTIVVLSEFGRRVAENASKGTDHGRGGCMFVLGNGINGGQVYGDWPGLEEHQLNHGDLEITTDYRTILAELIRKKMPGGSLESIFPDFNYSAELGIFL